MPTDLTPQQRKALLEQRRRKREKAIWLWKRRVVSFALLVFAFIAALVSVILSIAIPLEEDAPEPVASAAPAVSETAAPTPVPVEAPLGDLWLVNGEYGWDFDLSFDYANVYEEKIHTYNVRDTDILLAEHIMIPLNRMLMDFDLETGCDDLLLCAGLRTEEDQQYLRDRGMETHGAEHTNTFIALPGYSEHHTGLALDFAYYDVYTGDSYDFDGTGDEIWILEHCWEYGFVQRYPAGKIDITGIGTEEWHFRYVGLPHAKIMYEEDLCLEEYLTYLQQFPYDGEHLTAEQDGISYEIWYCPLTDVHYPESGSYTVSGDNCGGLIVTLQNES